MARFSINGQTMLAEHTTHLMAAARGDEEVDLLLTGGQVLHVHSGEILPAELAIKEGRIVGHGPRKAKKTVDVQGAILVPGLIDVHFHIESSMLTPARLTEVLLPRGTTTIVADPHEIANVHGKEGVRWMHDASERLPLDFRLWLPSCVPATHLETSGATLTAEDLHDLSFLPRVAGLGEMMNDPGVVYGDEAVHAKLIMAEKRTGFSVDGHAPGLTGPLLDAYLLAGIEADHECTRLEEAREKLRKGMRVLIREGTAARNLDDLLPLITPETWPFISFVLDDRHVDDLVQRGGLDSMIRQAIRGGLEPVTAIRLATLTPAQRMGWRTRGHLGPGAQADLIVLDELEAFRIRQVYSDGKLVAEKGELLVKLPSAPAIESSMKIEAPTAEAFAIPDPGTEVLAIGLVSGQILTKAVTVQPRVRHDQLHADPTLDLAKLAVIERHQGTGNIGLGFVQGLRLKRGAIASSVAHDSHNLIVAGMDDASMAMAAEAVIQAGGGLAVADGRRMVEVLPLPIGGLMSDWNGREVAGELGRLLHQTADLGAEGDPFMALSFLALPVIPELRLTDKGLVDVGRFEVVPLSV